MRKECEGIFIELISPYLTAQKIASRHGDNDWHGVFSFEGLAGKNLTK